MSNTVWTPQPRQSEFMMRGEDEALYGGAAGGGKSDALVIEALRQVHIPHYKALILRKTFPQLTELIEKSLLYYPPAFPSARYNASEHTWRFPSGAKVVFGSMQNTQARLNYQGKAFDVILFDELTHFSYEEYIYLSSRNRPNGPGTRCYIRATANPGGVGHGWVKERFITAAPPMTTIWEDVEVISPDGEKTKGRRSRIFVPSSVFDNKILLANDPNYVMRLASLPEAEKQALLYGDWDSYSGQYFTEFKNDPAHYVDRAWTHVIEPFEVPSHWQIYRSFDWGYSKPFSAGYWAVSESGKAYRIAECYGCVKGEADVGVKWNTDRVFLHLRKFEDSHRWLRGKNIHGVADPSIWNVQYGESPAETAAKYRIYFEKGDNERIAGWMMVRNYLQFDDEGNPRMQIFKTCKDFIRTIPLLQYDDYNCEDINTKLEDHIADEMRYFCMARPIRARVKDIDPYSLSPQAQVLDIPKEDLTALPYHRRVEILDD